MKLGSREQIVPLAIAGALGLAAGLYSYLAHDLRAETPLLAFERKLLDLKFQVRGRIEVEPKVVIAAGDEKTVQAFGRWGTWDRARYAKIIENLMAAGADTIAFDMVFADPPGLDHVAVGELKGLLGDAKLAETIGGVAVKLSEGGKTSPAEMAQIAMAAKAFEDAFAQRTRSDAILAGAFDEYTSNIVQGFIANAEPEDGKTFRTSFVDEIAALDAIVIRNYAIKWQFKDSETAAQAGAEKEIAQPIMKEGGRPSDLHAVTAVRGDLVLPQKEFRDAASYLGFFSAYTDPDGVLRRQPLVYRVDDVFIPALSVSTAMVHFGGSAGLVYDEAFPFGLKSVGFPREDGTIVEVPVDLNGYLLVNYYGPSGAADRALPDDKRGVFPRLSLADIHDGTFDKAAVKGKVVMIAVTAIGTFDQRVTPFSPNVPGVEVHAAAVQNMIDGRALKRPTLYLQLEVLMALFVALMFGLVLPRLPPAIALLVFASELVTWVLVDFFVLFPRDMWFHDVPLAIQMALSWGGITVWGYLTTGRDKARLKKEFSTVLAPTVVDQLLKDPKLAGLGGMERELTVMFSDIRGFTTMSEKLTPEGLTQFLNEYLTPMTEILIKREGTLDKYMGDAIMAFWGAPIEQKDHAARAALAALDMMEKLHELQKKWLAEGKPEIDIGIGLNSGLMRVGFMGSERMRNYTLLGDNVNLGSRLEGTNKNYGTHIIVSQTTYDQSKHVVYGRWLDAVRVKGKREPVNIYELLGKLPHQGGQAPASVGVWIAKFEEGMRHYHAKRWDQAEACFHEVVRLKGHADAPSELYIERVQHFRAEPPPENWDGVYEFKTK